ncbi:MAG: hypothetical protein M1816_003989 [Peltula sp. TS41687]|nr:MAG: hypothetical protein M1816_003989 [Peltula sp. TS41687]
MDPPSSPVPQAPFGYSFETISTPPPPAPLAPASGPSLLDDAETNIIFIQVSSMVFDDTAFGLANLLQPQGESGTTLEWPSNFPGTINPGDQLSAQALSSAQPFPSADQINFESQFLADPAFHGVSPSDDVLLAASTLLGTSQNQITGFPGEASTEGLLSQHQFPHAYSQLSSVNTLSHAQPLVDYAASSLYMPEGPTSQPSHAIGLHDLTEPYIPQAAFGIQAPPLVSNNPVPGMVDVRWGSDISFLDTGYVAPPNQETEEDVTKDLMHTLEVMVAQNSANDTQPPIPEAIGNQESRKPTANFLKPAEEEIQESQPQEVQMEARPRKKRRYVFEVKEPSQGVDVDASTPSKKGKLLRQTLTRTVAEIEELSQGVDIDIDTLSKKGKTKPNILTRPVAEMEEPSQGVDVDVPTPPKKGKARRKTLTRTVSETEELSQGVDVDISTLPKKRKARRKTLTEKTGNKRTPAPPLSSSAPSRRPRAASESQKPPVKESLTEEEKRFNHIVSEQRRRDLIKKGFEDLCSLVPDLHGPGQHSKSTILNKSADWLENQLKGNQELRAILADLKEKERKKEEEEDAEEEEEDEELRAILTSFNENGEEGA